MKSIRLADKSALESTRSQMARLPPTKVGGMRSQFFIITLPVIRVHPKMTCL